MTEIAHQRLPSDALSIFGTFICEKRNQSDDAHTRYCYTNVTDHMYANKHNGFTLRVHSGDTRRATSAACRICPGD